MYVIICICRKWKTIRRGGCTVVISVGNMKDSRPTPGGLTIAGTDALSAAADCRLPADLSPRPDAPPPGPPGPGRAGPGRAGDAISPWPRAARSLFLDTVVRNTFAHIDERRPTPDASTHQRC